MWPNDVRRRVLRPVAFCVVSFVLLAAALSVVLASNQLQLLMFNGYFIPAESSTWSFTATKMNFGSGEWWLYGEDDDQYFALSDDTPDYLVIAKDEVPAGFDPLDKSTWGSSAILRPIP